MRPVIVIGDQTSHGGTVVGAAPTTDTHGKRIARVGDQVTCPKKGHGPTVIVTGDPTMIVDGAPVARHGDLCACGAVLIASQAVTGSIEGSGLSARGATHAAASSVTSHATTSGTDKVADAFDQRFVLTCDLTGMPLARQPYRLRWKTQVVEGVTDDKGQTAAIATGSAAEEVVCEILGEVPHG